MELRVNASRWFRFRLLTLLLLVAIVAIPLAWIAKERRQSSRELQIADELGQQGFPTIRFGSPFDDWWEPYPPKSSKVWWGNLAKTVLGERIITVSVIAEGDRMRMGEIPAAVCNIEHLDLLAELTNLQVLLLDTTPIESATPLAGLRTLKWLSLSETKCTDLRPVAGLNNLERLWLNGTQVTDISPIFGLKKLTQLSLIQTPVTKEQIADFKKRFPDCVMYP